MEDLISPDPNDESDDTGDDFEYEFDFGDDAGDDDGGDDADLGDEDAGGDDSDSQWGEFIKAGVKPEDAWKTWNQYSQTREEALSERRAAEEQRRELEPIIRLRDEILNDAGLVDVIDNYMTTSRPADREVVDLKREVSDLRSRVETDAEYDSLVEWAEERKLPRPDKRGVLAYAVQNRIGSLQEAYKAQMFDDAQEAAVEKVVGDIKKSKGAKAVKPTQKDSGTKKVSIKDMATLPDDDFEKAFGTYVNTLKQKQG